MKFWGYQGTNLVRATGRVAGWHWGNWNDDPIIPFDGLRRLVAIVTTAVIGHGLDTHQVVKCDSIKVLILAQARQVFVYDITRHPQPRLLHAERRK